MCDLDDDSLEIISVEAVSDKSLMHLKNSLSDEPDLALYWQFTCLYWVKNHRFPVFKGLMWCLYRCL